MSHSGCGFYKAMTEKYLNQQNILMGVTGSIAAYKAADLASKLTQAGALVDVILTPAALEFITPLTFQSVTGRQAFTDKSLWGAEACLTCWFGAHCSYVRHCSCHR
jgi:phosphopantothenoylcysteine decarboxylase/phosphopantothenate--cysteine ligase